MAISLPYTAKSTFWPVRFAKFLRASRRLLKTSPVSMFTPGLRLKAFPKSRISPYLAIGGGYADYEQSTTEINGHPNPASRELARGVFDFGAGVDVRVWRWVALRGEARDFYSGSPDYNVASLSGGQHNVFA